MSTTDILRTFGAHYDGTTLTHFTQAEAEYGVLTDHAGIYCSPSRPFTLEGEDAQRWCNGMLSNNIRKLQPLQGNRNAVCNAKGTLEGLLYVYCLSESKFLCFPDGIDADWFGQRFRQFLFLDDIELEPLDEHCTLSLIGPKATIIASKLGYSSPEEEQQLVATDKGWAAFGQRFGLDCVDIVCPVDELRSQIERAQSMGAQLVGQLAYTHLRIQSGSAAWPDDKYSEKPLLHALRLNHDCCAFDKGCYVGQEVINRIDVKGILGRQLQLLKLSGAVPLGTALCDSESLKELAPLTSLSTLDETLGLAVLPKAYWAPNTKLTLGDTGETATVIDHPSATLESATPDD